ncbi:MAG: response regulator [Alphaproteobacteria bacterium]|nr:response regulator [Alphaproteobacteria bacterium]
MSDRKNITVLIVDDEAINVQLMWGLLENECEVLVATNGAEAIEIAKKGDTDLIMLDVMMPDMIGFDVCEKLRADASTCDIPVIFLTSLADPLDREIGFSVGGVDYVTKPFSEVEVLARVRTQMELIRLRQELKDCRERLAAADRPAG